MPGKKARMRKRYRPGRGLAAVIMILCVVAAALTVTLIRSDPLGTNTKPAVRYPDKLIFSDNADATPVPLVLGTTPQPTAEPTAEATAPAEAEATLSPVAALSDVGDEPAEVYDAPDEGDTVDPSEGEDAEPAEGEDAAPVETASPANRLMPEAQGEGFLPILRRALRTPDDPLEIAVTVDDCNDASALQQVVDLARKYGAKLTLFPVGEVLMKPGMTSGFRTCLTSYGFEIENHTFGHKAEYRLGDPEIALQIWKGGLAASYMAGRDYTTHFYRPYNNLSVMDQRTHFMCEKLGYLGIASYTYSYKDVSTADELLSTLANGNIYQFDMKEESLAMFEAFLRGANKKGYKMVTMNALFGLEENALASSLNLDKAELPSMSDFTTPLYDLYLGDRTHAVYRLQTRLRQLGYLITMDENAEPRKADGIYGADTSTAVSMFQGQAGLPATGNADVATQEALYAEYAPIRPGYAAVSAE